MRQIIAAVINILIRERLSQRVLQVHAQISLYYKYTSKFPGLFSRDFFIKQHDLRFAYRVLWCSRIERDWRA
jgi:hypothetical protein